MKDATFLGDQNILWPLLRVFGGSRLPNPQDIRHWVLS